MPGRGTEPGPELYPECGTAAGYRLHRRDGTRTCRKCRAWQARDMARYRVQRIIKGRRLVPAIGTHRRIRALGRIGWGHRELAERTRLSRSAFSHMMSQSEINRERAGLITRTYRDLWDQPGPNRLVAQRAAKRGWPGPGDWDDPDNPDEVPVCEIERAHEEALAEHLRFKRRERRRAQKLAERPDPRRLVIVDGGQAGSDCPATAQMKAAMTA